MADTLTPDQVESLIAVATRVVESLGPRMLAEGVPSTVREEVERTANEALKKLAADLRHRLWND
jgi:hypothetical protein